MKLFLFLGAVLLWAGIDLSAATLSPPMLSVRMEPRFRLRDKGDLLLKVTVTNKGSALFEFDSGGTGDLSVVSAGTWTAVPPRIIQTGGFIPATVRLASGESETVDYVINRYFRKIRAGANDVRFRLVFRPTDAKIPTVQAEVAVTYRLTPRLAKLADSPAAKSHS